MRCLLVYGISLLLGFGTVGCGTGANNCEPDCTGKVCGDDGCGGLCGSCETGQTCSEGACIPGCDDQCSPAGSTQCTNGEIRSCISDQNGCLGWSDPADCRDGFCADATSCGTCANLCSPAGTTLCTNGEIRTCESDLNGCLDWGEFTDCQSGFCADAISCGDCDDLCSPVNSTQCENGQIRTCESDPNGCLDWGDFVDCLYGSCADSTSCAACEGEDCVPQAPKLIGPLSTSLVTTLEPRFTFELGADADSARIEICDDPDCDTVLQTLEGTSDVTAAPLDPGPVFWRGIGLRHDPDDELVIGDTWSPTWVATLRNSTAQVDTFWGHVPDWDRDGEAEIVTTGMRYQSYEYQILAFDDVDDRYPNVSLGEDLDSVNPVGDVNGDGFGDYVMIGENNDSGTYLTFAQICYGGSSWGCEARQYFEEDFDVYGLVAGFDINSDGYGDVILKATEGVYIFKLHLLLGSASGLSLDSHTMILDEPCDSLRVADFNADRYPDLACKLDGEIKIFESHGTEAFSLAATLVRPVNPSSGIFGSAVRVGELNGDGYGDLVVFQGNQQFHVYHGSPSGLADQPSQTVDLDGQADGVSALGDINGDGLDDLVWGKDLWPDGSIEVHLGTAAGFDAVSDQSFDKEDLCFRKYNLVGDLHGDGRTDLAISGDSTDASTSIVIHRGNNSGLNSYTDSMYADSYYLIWGGLGAVLPGSQ